MDDPSHHDPAPHGAGPSAPQNVPLQQPPLGPAPPLAPQLPPQMFTTAAQLLDLTDKKLMAVLRDGRKLIGVLRSWDQYGNIVLQDTVERLFVPRYFADIKRGIFLVRGENILLLGEIDLDKDDDIPEGYEQAPVEKVFLMQKAEEEKSKKREKRKLTRLQAYGFEGERAGEAIV